MNQEGEQFFTKGGGEHMASFYKQGDIAERRHVALHARQGGAGVRGDITERTQDILNPETADYAEVVQFIEDGIEEQEGESKKELLKSLFGVVEGNVFDEETWRTFIEDFACLKDIYYDTIDDEEKRMSPAQWERSLERVRFNEYLQRVLKVSPPMLRVSPSLE